jgi:nitric oxide reductase NorD protein
VAEPEDVIAEGALLATRAVRELWNRRAAGTTEPAPRLADYRRRLELFMAAIFPDAPTIGVAEAPAPLSLLTRIARRHTAHLFSPTAMASTDGARIKLPAELNGVPREQVLDRYRLLALEQAARVARGTQESAPSRDRWLRDLYHLAEAAAIDAWMVRLLPRSAPSLRQARREAATARPIVPSASPRERATEALLTTLLTADPALPPAPFVAAESAEGSLHWARARQLELRRLAGPYRGLAPVFLWGEPHQASELRVRDLFTGESGPAPGARSHKLPRRPRVREAGEDEDDATPGTWMVRADDLQEKAEDPAGLQRPADRDDQADPGELADSLSELPELRLVRSPGTIHEVLVGEDPIPRAPAPEAGALPGLVSYPEWDWRAAAYRLRAAIVRELPPEQGPATWVEAALARHAPLLRGVRRDFERLRPVRTALTRQADGSELDLEAMVTVFADRRAGGGGEHRVYVDTRPHRRDVAITLLVDASASTDGWVAGTRRIIDVEKEALLIVAEALAALGDPHAILAFTGQGPARVEIRVLKRFEERAGAAVVRGRIAGLEPGGYTRAGAAIRHATASLMRQAARHRLLLLLSDGRPNDLDQYEGRYGVEDTRVAVAEARLQGLACFCLTVDREAPRYAARIFGRDFAVLSRPERLPLVLTQVLRQLVRN